MTLASPPDLLAQRLQAALTWQWQSAEDLIQSLIPVVNPSKAMRAYQDRTPRTTSFKSMTDEEKIASGARAIINDRIGSLKQSGRIEVMYGDEIRPETGKPVRMIRFKEKRQAALAGHCPTCAQPFPQAPVERPKPPVPQRKSTVLYPDFPAWAETARRRAEA